MGPRSVAALDRALASGGRAIRRWTDDCDYEPPVVLVKRGHFAEAVSEFMEARKSAVMVVPGRRDSAPTST